MGDHQAIRVFVSSPADCEPERNAVERVLEELNKTVGEREKLFFQPLRWEDLPPGAGNPQAVIDEHLGAYNVLVGIMWMRFGTPVPGGGGSGTEHESSAGDGKLGTSRPTASNVLFQTRSAAGYLSN